MEAATRIITYSLKLDANRSDEYYRAISSFSDSWLAQARHPEVLRLVSGFGAYRQACRQVDRSEAEYLFELLALGVILREHGGEIRHLPRWAERLLHTLVALQSRFPRAEQMVKFLRGWLGWLVDRAPGRERGEDLLNRMIAWLGANDESVNAERFREWYDYFQSNGERFTQEAVSLCLDLAEEFEGSSRKALGKYTEGVERFLSDEAPRYRRRYDFRLLTRTRLEYHLGMLGAEILNRAFRARFLAARRKMVILPPCMCAPAEECQAVETPFGAKCQACTPTCRVHQITKLGEKLGFSVTMIPDDVKVFGSGKEVESVGLVGVSCALTNWNGGWDAGAVGIPAQGLLLDYVGCKFHWDRHGFPTDTNLSKLREILGW